MATAGGEPRRFPDVALDGLEVRLGDTMDAAALRYLLRERREDFPGVAGGSEVESDVAESLRCPPSDKVFSPRASSLVVASSNGTFVRCPDTTESRCDSSSTGMR